MCSTEVISVFLGPDREVSTRLDYTSFDPYSVHLQFQDKGRYIEWEVARDLLLAGMFVPTWFGLSDVQVCRVNDAEMGLRLESPSGEATFLLPLVDVSRFLGRTMLETPIGDELVTIEDSPDALVEGAL